MATLNLYFDDACPMLASAFSRRLTINGARRGCDGDRCQICIGGKDGA